MLFLPNLPKGLLVVGQVWNVLLLSLGITVHWVLKLFPSRSSFPCPPRLKMVAKSLRFCPTPNFVE
jgi:hypothetical protein